MTWVIRCRVSGGPTGTRESTVMRDGAVVEYLTKAEAQQEAMRLEVDRNHLYATTFFEYWVAEYAATKHTTTKHTTTAKKQEGA